MYRDLTILNQISVLAAVVEDEASNASIQLEGAIDFFVEATTGKQYTPMAEVEAARVVVQIHEAHVEFKWAVASLARMDTALRKINILRAELATLLGEK